MLPPLKRLNEHFTKTGDLMFRGGKPPVTVEQELAQQFTSANQYLDAARNAGLDVTTPAVQAGAQKFGEQAVAAMGPSRLARFGPSAALASGIAAGTGFLMHLKPKKLKLKVC